MSETILCVDDEPNVLHSLERLFMDDNIDIMTATNAADALDILKNNRIAVIISDNKMPKVTGIDFLQMAKNISPDSVRLMLTAFADAKSAIDAINKGEVYKFITKPWDDAELKDIVFNTLNRYKIALSMKKANEATLLSLSQTIELKDPYTRGHCDRVAAYALKIAETLGRSKDEQQEIKYGSWLHDCGKIGVPEAILNYNGPLLDEQIKTVKNHSVWGADVARLAQLSGTVINIILCHHEHYDGTGYPYGLKGNDIPLEARIVAVADVYDALTSQRPYRNKMDPQQAQEILIDHKGSVLDPEIVDIFIKGLGVTR